MKPTIMKKYSRPLDCLALAMSLSHMGRHKMAAKAFAAACRHPDAVTAINILNASNQIAIEAARAESKPVKAKAAKSVKAAKGRRVIAEEDFSDEEIEEILDGEEADIDAADEDEEDIEIDLDEDEGDDAEDGDDEGEDVDADLEVDLDDEESSEQFAKVVARMMKSRR